MSQKVCQPPQTKNETFGRKGDGKESSSNTNDKVMCFVVGFVFSY